jgi:hypothetical protein
MEKPAAEKPVDVVTSAAEESAGCDACGAFADEPFRYPGRFYTGAEYLLWWTKGHRLPALIATGAPGSLATTAALGQPGTQVLFGEDEVDTDVRSGGRFTLGYWLNDRQTVGVEASGLFLGDASSDFNGSAPILGRPFANADVVPFPETSLLVSFPNLFNGRAAAATNNRFWGVEANGRFNVAGNSYFRLDLLAGFRFLDVADELSVTSVSTPAPQGFLQFGGQPIPNATSLTVSDRFCTCNEYYAGQVGAHFEVIHNRWSWDFRGKLALGAMNQTVNIAGATTLVTSTGTVTVPGGLLAQRSNIGSYSRSELGFVPEVGVNVAYQLTGNLKAFVGYSLIYFRSDIVRSGEQIDRVVSFNQVPALGPGSPAQPRPAFGFVDTDFWAQGVNFGLQLDF